MSGRADDPRTAFLAAYPGILLLDPLDATAIGRYLLDRGLATAADLPVAVERAGAGNMNLTLRVGLGSGRSLILKQGRPWVEKYDQIPAPWERTVIEGAFYELMSGASPRDRADERDTGGARAEARANGSGHGPGMDPATGMPALLDLDPENHVLALEDLGAGGDCTSMYEGGPLHDNEVDWLLSWLEALAAVTVPADRRPLFANREMRTLNHEHIFRFPLARQNGLDLDAITPGLAAAAEPLKDDAGYIRAAESLGRLYLADGAALVHGDFFPGSWIRTARGLRIIDPEFCFLGAPEFDYGVMLAHAALARAPRSIGARVLEAVARRGLQVPLTRQLAGIEVMRRLIGVAQLPLPYGLEEKRGLLDLSRRLVLHPEEDRSW